MISLEIWKILGGILLVIFSFLFVFIISIPAFEKWVRPSHYKKYTDEYGNYPHYGKIRKAEDNFVVIIAWISILFAFATIFCYATLVSSIDYPAHDIEVVYRDKSTGQIFESKALDELNKK